MNKNHLNLRKSKPVQSDTKHFIKFYIIAIVIVLIHFSTVTIMDYYHRHSSEVDVIRDDITIGYLVEFVQKNLNFF